MEVLSCTLCLHPCHCKGVGPYINTNKCIGYDCDCRTCTHPIIKEDNDMVKKVIKWVWNIICWPFKKVKDWLWS